MSRLSRTAAVLAATAAALLTVTACGGGGSSDGKQSLTVWHELTGSGNDAINGIITGFNAGSADATVKARQIADSEVDTVLRTGMSGPNPPDILQYEGYRHTADYAKAGQLTDITDWWNAHKAAFTLPDSQIVKDACTYEGKVYCIPWDLYTNNQLYYNPDLLKQYNLTPPRTLDELKATAAKLAGTGITPVALYSKDGWPAAQWWYLLSIQRCGVATVKAAVAGQGAGWSEPCFTQAAQDLADLGKAGVFPQGVAGSDYNAQLSLFTSGKALFMNTGTWFEQTIAETPPTFQVQVAPLPLADPAHGGQLLGGVNEVFGVPARGKHPQQALEFLDTLAKPASGQAFAKAGVMNFVVGASDALPPRLKSAWDTAVTQIDGGDNLVTYFENLVPPSVGSDAMYNGATSVAAGTKTPSQFTQELSAAATSAK
jgi:raffinose/stachyose/melibiose transport system substrate-binding protein